MSSRLESEEPGQSRAGQTLRLLPQTHAWWSELGLGPCISNPLPGDELPLVQGPQFVYQALDSRLQGPVTPRWACLPLARWSREGTSRPPHL